MRKSFVFVGLVAAVLMGAAPAFAQKIDFGAKVGPQWSTVTHFEDNSAGVTTEMRTGLAVGGFVAFKVAKKVEIQPEVLYSQEGVTGKFSSGSSSIEEKLKADFIRIPVLIRLGDIGKPGIYGLFGPSFGIVASAKDEFDGVTTDFKDEVKGFETSLIFGGGYSMKHALIEARYQLGLQDLAKNPDPGESTHKGRTFMLLFGVHGSKK